MSQATLDSERAGRGFLIDMLLDQQQQLSAVERFAQQHEAHATPLGARLYQDLIPLTLPGPGEQFAFEVDLDACSGCKACVAACHNLNGLEEDELWRSVGLLVGGTEQLPVIHHVTTACHHCVEPACLQGCPVKAYEKDPVTGIVRHLDDQCIGCQYCVLKCPYDVPAYSPSKGIVRKCDMCHQRLSAGEAPACVQSCPNQAIRIGIVEQATAKQAGAENRFLPTAPAPDYTIPTTVYKSTKGFSDGLVAGDYYTMRRAHSHMPLVVLLVLTQLAVGGFLAIHALQLLTSAFAIASTSLLRPIALTAAFAVLQAGLGASVLHLGRPLYGFRAFLGWRTSWMSREIIVFGAFAGLAGATASAAWSDRLFIAVPPLVQSALSVMTTLVGLLAVFCSAMIYIDTRRPTWSFGATTAKFYLTTLASGSALVATASLLTQYFAASPSSPLTLSAVVTGLCWMIMLGSASKLALELSVLRQLQSDDHTPARRSAMLLIGPLHGLLMARLGLGIVGGVLLPLVMLLGLSESAMASHLLLLCGTSVVSMLLLIGGELVERYLFFATCVAAKMPGAPAT